MAPPSNCRMAAAGMLPRKSAAAPVMDPISWQVPAAREINGLELSIPWLRAEPKRQTRNCSKSLNTSALISDRICLPFPAWLARVDPAQDLLAALSERVPVR